MKRIFFTAMLLTATIVGRAQQISYIETTRSWYYIYDENGKRLRGISASSGELVGYGPTFYILRQNSFYIMFDVKGKRLGSLSKNNAGEIISVSGETFTSRNGSWIYTWRKDGKKLSSRPAH